MTKEELAVILENHRYWIHEDIDGWETMRANLTGANLRGADLIGANLEKTKINYPIACPEEGSFIAWKKAKMMCVDEHQYTDVIIKLLIPEDAKRSSATTRKCRANKAVVLEGYVLSNPELKLNSDSIICSIYDKRYTYKIGDTLEILDFNENRWVECAPGIHFFITRREAEEYC